MISVIIPYYNPESDTTLEHLLERAVRSALSQFSAQDAIQVIVVDDGSLTPPQAAINAIGDSRVQLTEASHGRLGAARNRGIEAAQGDVLAFLDADDYYFPGTLERCLDAMRECDADLFGFRFRICPEEGSRPAGQQTIHLSEPMTGNGYMARHTPFGSSCMYLISRSLLTGNNLRFAENTYMEDEDFTPRLLFHSKRYVASDALVYAYCRRSGSITTAPLYDERAANTLNVIKRLVEFRRTVAAGHPQGIDRKIHFLAMDHIRRTLRRPDWRESLPVQTAALQAEGLWPLFSTPAYGIRYRLFTSLSRCHAGLALLHINEKRYRL